MRLLRYLLALLLLAAAPGAQAQSGSWGLPHGNEEKILSFVSDVQIARDGALDVTETIRIVALNREINRGILRDFPTSYKTRAGQRSSVGFEVLSVTRNGQVEPWQTSSLSNGVRVRIGSPDVILPVGQHTYVIRYRTTRQIFYGKDSDELYWNATGTGWTFPIDMAEARITLPSAAEFGDRAVYTGPQGSTAHNAEVIADEPGHIAFRTTAPLGREEGLTVAAAFPKGVLVEPDASTRLGWWLEDWGALATALLGMLGVAFYYFHAWRKAGRGPRAGTVVPIFAPPEGLSAAAVRYISKMGFDNRAFSAALVELGVRGKLHIAQEQGRWFTRGTTTLSATDIARPGNDRPLPTADLAMRSRLFLAGDSIELKQVNHTTLQAARSALEDGLASAYVGKMFLKNRDWAVYGLFLIVLTMLGAATVAMFATSLYPDPVKLGLPMLAVLLLIAAWLIKDMASRNRAAGSSSCLPLVVAGLLGLAGAAAAVITVFMAVSINAPAVLLPLLLLPLAISAFWWMYAPTREGRAVMDRIAGFRQYLSITEESRLDAMHPPEKTPELFERYLPYAIALDVENRWAERFAGVLAAAAASGAAAGTASWYSGGGNVWDDPQGFASEIGSSFASTVSSAATSPSSSGGGSSGGGSSGGGGGGGGGSGW